MIGQVRQNIRASRSKTRCRSNHVYEHVPITGFFDLAHISKLGVNYIPRSSPQVCFHYCTSCAREGAWQFAGEHLADLYLRFSSFFVKILTFLHLLNVLSLLKKSRDCECILSWVISPFISCVQLLGYKQVAQVKRVGQTLNQWHLCQHKGGNSMTYTMRFKDFC